MNRDDEYATRIEDPLNETATFVEALTNSIEGCLGASSSRQRQWWNSVLSEVFDRLAPGGEPPQYGMAREAFLLFSHIASRHANMAVVVADAPVWLVRHHPAIVQEAQQLRPPSTYPDRPNYVKAGRAALELSCDGEFFEWARNALEVDLSRSMKITYIFYGTAGQRCRLHLDNLQHYEYNCLIGVKISRYENAVPGSFLRVIMPTGNPNDIDLVDRKVALFHSSRMAHGRMPLSPGEDIILLSIGLSAR